MVWKSKGLKVSFWWTCRISTRKRILQLPGNDFGTTLLLALDFLFQLNWVDWSRFYILVCLGTLWLDTIPLHNTRGRCVCSCRVESVKLYFFGIFDFSFLFLCVTIIFYDDDMYALAHKNIIGKMWYKYDREIYNFCKHVWSFGVVVGDLTGVTRFGWQVE